jgi:ribokinase
MVLDVIGYGSLNYDHIYIVENLAFGDRQVEILSTQNSPGGSAANTIFNLARLNVKTGFVGGLGNDNEGKEIQSHMAEAGIDIRLVKISNHSPTSKVLVFVDTQGERAMYSLPGVNKDLEIDDQDVDYLKSSEFTAFSAIPGSGSLEKIKQIIDQIYLESMVVFMPGGLYSNLGLEKLRSIISRSHLTVLNRREINAITGCEDDYTKGAAKLGKIGCKNIVVTTGKNGVFVYPSSDMKGLNVSTSILAQEMVVDSTGAGDAFTAGLLYGLLMNKDLPDAAVYGNLAARACVQAVGARAGLLDQTSLEEEYYKFVGNKGKYYE